MMRASVCGMSLLFLLWSASADSAEQSSYGTPQLAAYLGWIYEPLSDYTMDQWLEGLGDKFDADQWAKDFKEAGCSYVVFYTKWIDGFCFWDTKATGFKTKRDFVKELSDACHRHGLRFHIYWNHNCDGNPEFDKWSVYHQDGQPSVFGKLWPCRRQRYVHQEFPSL